MMEQATEVIMTNQTKPVKLATAKCLNCHKSWIIRTEAPKKCPRCFQAKVQVKGVKENG